MTGKRLRNELRCRFYYLLSRVGIVRVADGPCFASIEPASFCQLRCPECPVGTGASGQEKRLIDMALYRTAVDAVAETAHTLILYFQGEPLLHPHIADMVRYAHEKRLFTILSTNGQALTQDLAQALAAAGLDRIILSIDGLTQSAYQTYRVGGSVEKALAGLRYAAEAGIPERVMQCLCLKTNETEWDEMRRRYKSLGATRLELKTAQFYDFEKGHPLMPSDTRYARYEQRKDGSWRRKKALHNRCLRLWRGCVITAKGEVLPCCFDKAHAHVFGSLLTQSLPEIWHSAAAQSFRARVTHARSLIYICRNCDN